MKITWIGWACDSFDDDIVAWIYKLGHSPSTVEAIVWEEDGRARFDIISKATFSVVIFGELYFYSVGDAVTWLSEHGIETTVDDEPVVSHE